MGGTQTQGGAGGNYLNTFYAASGIFGNGGSAATGTQGGGGGGGWYGGGGGAFGDGGGGSSYTNSTATGVTHTQGYQEGSGLIVLKWLQPPVVVQTAGLPSGSEFPVGTTTNTFTATDADGNTSQASFNIIVSDTQSPVGIAPADVVTNTDEGSCGASNVSLGTPKATDNCGVASITNDAPSTFPVGSTMVTWLATDIHGNIATATQRVTVTDNQNPIITAPANVSVSVNMGSSVATNVTLGTPVSADNCSIATIFNDAPASYHVGTNIVNWTAIDRNGNTTTASQIVTVTDNQNPTIIAPSDVMITLSNGSASAVNVKSWNTNHCGQLQC